MRESDPEECRESSGGGEKTEKQDPHLHAMLGVNGIMVSDYERTSATYDANPHSRPPILAPPSPMPHPSGRHRLGSTSVPSHAAHVG